MSLSHGHSAAASTHLEALIAKHTLLSQTIDEEMKHASVNFLSVKMLKRQKMRLKEQIEFLRQNS